MHNFVCMHCIIIAADTYFWPQHDANAEGSGLTTQICNHHAGNPEPAAAYK